MLSDLGHTKPQTRPALQSQWCRSCLCLPTAESRYHFLPGHRDHLCGSPPGQCSRCWWSDAAAVIPPIMLAGGCIDPRSQTVVCSRACSPVLGGEDLQTPPQSWAVNWMKMSTTNLSTDRDRDQTDWPSGEESSGYGQWIRVSRLDSIGLDCRSCHHQGLPVQNLAESCLGHA